ncbi:MAG: hypothetical protein IKE43_11750 [Coriobacteriales bacterium]|nr:hypothetical protein [Coriobacteriales bacterium]
MAMLTRRKFIALGVALACAADGARIWSVNKNAPIQIPVVHHAIGEEVNIDGTFIATNNELTQGYYVTIKDAKLSSYNEFIRNYANDGSEPIEGLDYPAFVDLTWLLRSERSKDDPQTGGINMLYISLVPERRNTYYYALRKLILKSQEKLRRIGSDAVSFGILPGTEYELHIPYGHLTGTQIYMGKRIENAYLCHMEDTKFELYLSNWPVRHIVDITCA